MIALAYLAIPSSRVCPAILGVNLVVKLILNALKWSEPILGASAKGPSVSSSRGGGFGASTALRGKRVAFRAGPGRSIGSGPKKNSNANRRSFRAESGCSCGSVIGQT